MKRKVLRQQRSVRGVGYLLRLRAAAPESWGGFRLNRASHTVAVPDFWQFRWHACEATSDICASTGLGMDSGMRVETRLRQLATVQQ